MASHPARPLPVICVPLFLLLSCGCCFSQTLSAARDDAIVSSVFLPKTSEMPALDLSSGLDVWPERIYNEATALFAKGRYTEAAATYKKACPVVARACTNLGVMYSQGKGLEVNYGTASELYELGCDHGNPLGCTDLGILYWTNELPKDDTHSIELFERACREGDGSGCRTLGYIYEHGYGGMAENGNRAKELYELADKLSRTHYVPFYMENGMVVIQLLVHDETANLVVDTGSNHTIVKPGIFPLSGPFISTKIYTTTGELDAFSLSMEWNLDGHKVEIPALGSNFQFPRGTVGVLGGDVLAMFKSVRIDYAEMYLVLEEK